MLVGAPGAVHVYACIAKLAALGLVAAFSVWMNSGSRWGWRPPAPFLQCAFLSFLFLAVTPGFGVQYMAWLVPWTCLLRVREAIAVHLTSGVFLFAYYTRGCGRVPWYLANSARTPVWNGWLILLGLVCWAVICVMVVRFAARLLVAGPANEVSAEVAPGVQGNGAPALRA